MSDQYLTIQQMNKEPLQQHAKKLLQQEQKVVSEAALYLTQVAELILNNPQIREEYQSTEMWRQKFYEMTEVVETLLIKKPISQMNWMMNDDLTDEENQEEMMSCKTLEELINLIVWNIVFNLDMVEARRMADLDRTVSGYND